MTTDSPASVKEVLEQARNTSQQIDLLSRLLEEDRGAAAFKDCIAVLEELKQVSRKRSTLPFRTVCFLKRLSEQQGDGDIATLRQNAEHLLHEIGRIDVPTVLTKNEEKCLLEWLADPYLGWPSAEAVVKSQEHRADISHTTSIAHFLCGRALECGFRRRNERLNALEALAGLVEMFGDEILTDTELEDLYEIKSGLLRFLWGRQTVDCVERIFAQIE